MGSSTSLSGGKLVDSLPLASSDFHDGKMLLMKPSASGLGGDLIIADRVLKLWTEILKSEE